MTVPFERLESLYHAARRRPAEERGAFLTEACGSDQELRREIESLLGQHAATGGFLAGVPRVPALAAGTRIGIYRITAQRNVKPRHAKRRTARKRTAAKKR
jgi:hypothetical protein